MDKRCQMYKNIYENLVCDGDSEDLKFCKVYNCVYKFWCAVSNRNCIGQTYNPINIRFNNHNTDIRILKANRQEQVIEIRHFVKHGIDNIKISVLDISLNEIERKLYENNIMRKHLTAYSH